MCENKINNNIKTIPEDLTQDEQSESMSVSEQKTSTSLTEEGLFDKETEVL